MRKVSSEHMGYKGIDEASFAQMGGWENDIAKAYNDCYKRTMDWATTCRKLSETYRPMPSCHAWHMDYPFAFEESPFPPAPESIEMSARDEATLKLQSTLIPVVHKVGALMFERHPKASIWGELKMFQNPNWPAYAKKVSEWTAEKKQDESANAEQAVSDALGTVNRGLVAKMTQVENKLHQVIDVISNLLNSERGRDGAGEDRLHEVIEVQAQTISSQQTVIADLQATINAKDAEIFALRRALASAGQGTEEAEKGASEAAASAAAPAASVTASAAVQRSSPTTSPTTYQPHDEKVASLDASFRDFATRYHIEPASGSRPSLGELLAQAGSVTAFLGGGSGCTKTDLALKRTFQKVVKLDKFILKEFRAAGEPNAETPLSERNSQCWIRAHEHYQGAYSTLNKFYNKVIQKSSSTIQCLASTNCTGNIVETQFGKQKKCKICNVQACGKCGRSWADSHTC